MCMQALAAAYATGNNAVASAASSSFVQACSGVSCQTVSEAISSMNLPHPAPHHPTLSDIRHSLSAARIHSLMVRASLGAKSDALIRRNNPRVTGGELQIWCRSKNDTMCVRQARNLWPSRTGISRLPRPLPLPRQRHSQCACPAQASKPASSPTSLARHFTLKSGYL